MNILAIHGPQIGGCEYHRIVGPMNHLAKHHKDLSITFGHDLCDYRLADLLNYQAVVVHRTITSVPSFFDVVEAVLKQASHLKLIVDTDDHWQLSPEDPRYQEWQDYGIGQMIERTLAMASHVWVSTKTLHTEVLPINPNCSIVPNAIDTQLAMWRVAAGKLKSNRYRIGIFCQPTHWNNIARLKTGLRRTLANNTDVDIVCIGVSHGQQVNVLRQLGLTYKDPVIFRERLPLDEYADHYRHVDILLAPLQHDDFNRHRSALKLWECAASQTPIIAEDFGPYQLNVTGIKRTSDWDNLHKMVRRHREIIPITELKPTYTESQALRYKLLVE